MDYPYLIPVIAGALAGGSAVLLRRTERTFGAWLGWLSLAAAGGAAAAFAAGFLWAASFPPIATPSTWQAVAGLALALAGGTLVGWALRVRGIGVLRLWPSDRVETQVPFRAIRRPVELGVMISTTGLCWLRPAPSTWICLGVWIVLWSAVLELGDWEFRHRLPACRDYLKRTPRYLPRRLTFRQRPAHSV